MTTKVPIELSSTPSIVDGGNATAITIDSSENVGIGITSSLEKFTVSNSSSGIVGRFTNNTNQTLDLGVVSGSGAAGGVYYNSANSGYQAFQVGGSEKMRLSGSNLHLTGGADVRIQLGTSGTGNAAVSNNTVNIRGDNDWMKLNAAGNGGFIFEENGTERMRIDSSGHIGIGISSPTTHYEKVLHIHESSGSSAIHMTNNTTGSAQGDGTDLIMYGNDFYYWNREDNGNMIFGTSNSTEGTTTRMTINGIGQISMGHATHPDDVLYLTRAGNGKLLRFYSGSTEVGSISTNTYSLPSDKDFKKDISDLTLGLDFIKSLNPKTYRHKIDDNNTPLSTGLLAQEVEASLTSLGVTKNSLNLVQHIPDEDDKQSQYWMSNESLIPVLIKGMKEQQTIIDDLKSRIKTLEDA